MSLNLTARNGTEQRVLDYLEANASEALRRKINTGIKTLAGALKYAKDEAFKHSNGEGYVCVDDATVFGWIVHFFEEDHIEETVKRPAVRTPTGTIVKPATVRKHKKQTKVGEQLELFQAIMQETP